MTKSSIILVSLAQAVVFLGRAQSPPVLFTMASDSNGQLTLTVQNLGTSALTACAYIADIHSKVGDEIRPETIQEHALHDFAFAERDPILPNQARSFHISGWNATVTSVAALWVGGSSFGDPVLIQKLMQKRALAVKHIDIALSILQEARRSGRSLSETASRADSAEAQVDRDSDDPDIAYGLRIYYDQIKRRLTGKRLQHSGGQPFSDAETMDQAIRELENYRQGTPLY